MDLRPEQLNEREILRYLGCRTEIPPEDLVQSVRRCSREVAAAARPKTVWRLFPLEGSHPAGTAVTFEGKDIARHLADCHSVILMAATLGPDIESLLLRAQVRDMAEALVLDACASTAIEAVCDKLEAELRSEWEAKGGYLTDRFSPGYGDFPITQQLSLCGLLDVQRRIGLTLSASGILIPRKSVTAVMGIADSPRHRRSRGCEGCAMYEHCQMRKGGTPCGS